MWRGRRPRRKGLVGTCPWYARTPSPHPSAIASFGYRLVDRRRNSSGAVSFARSDIAGLPFESATIRRRAHMKTVTTIGLDIAKSVFQVHGVDCEAVNAGHPEAVDSAVAVLRVFYEAAAVPRWHRSLRRRRITGRVSCTPLGHAPCAHAASLCEAVLSSARRTMRADAEAICEAVQRPSMRFVPRQIAGSAAARLSHGHGICSSVS